MRYAREQLLRVDANKRYSLMIPASPQDPSDPSPKGEESAVDEIERAEATMAARAKAMDTMGSKRDASAEDFPQASHDAVTEAMQAHRDATVGMHEHRYATSDVYREGYTVDAGERNGGNPGPVQPTSDPCPTSLVLLTFRTVSVDPVRFFSLRKASLLMRDQGIGRGGAFRVVEVCAAPDPTHKSRST